MESETEKMTKQLSSLLLDMPTHRRILMTGWGEDTIAQGWPYRKNDPTGQCGPTALWVTLHLRQHGYDALYAQGSVTVGGVTAISNHAWTEVDGHIVDLTCSQGVGIDVECIATWRGDLESRWIKYTTRESGPPQEFTKWTLWERYDRMVQRMNSIK